MVLNERSLLGTYADVFLGRLFTIGSNIVIKSWRDQSNYCMAAIQNRQKENFKKNNNKKHDRWL